MIAERKVAERANMEFRESEVVVERGERWFSMTCGESDGGGG